MVAQLFFNLAGLSHGLSGDAEEAAVVRLFLSPHNVVQCLEYQGAGHHHGQIDRTVSLHFIPDMDDKSGVHIINPL